MYILENGHFYNVILDQFYTFCWIIHIFIML